MKIPQYILEKPLLTMTGSEVLELFSVVFEQETTTHDFTGEHLVHGLDGLAKLLGCGRTKAQQIKNSGVIDEAMVQDGRKLVFDGPKTLELLKKQNKI
ncbi:DUF3853 family protein [Riemerella anatipestifer]|uniref:DUF3853 domain-containing protein n=1 Tax=Riemerella anatipestifer TaxID=34085 RepID=A0A1S7DQJ7_RIEAN|nr:DUF3853 family protein [Riemerella anatipestifer]AQY21376.1 hypothetical protein AB406_0417 [Riemerella anatipestifer]